MSIETPDGIPVDKIKSSIGKQGIAPAAIGTDVRFDPTDDDTDHVYELTKIAIEHGTKVADIDIKSLIPYFDAAKKEARRKHRNQKIVEFFTGTGFMMLVYIIMDKVFP